MARYRPRKPLHWPLDYGWGYPRWRWNTWRDVLLEAQPWTQHPDAVRAAVQAWLAGKEQGMHEVDGVPRAIAYQGGIWMYAEDAEGGQPALRVYLHSSGEDAFDTLKSYADELVEVLLAADPAVKVKWIKHPHQRHVHRETARGG